MKKAILIARLLLGLISVVFGLNGFFVFIPPPEHTQIGGAFIDLLIATKFIYVEKSLEIVAGLLLLLNRYVPLALALLGPLVINILLFHILMERYTLVIGVIPFLLWGFLMCRFRGYFAPLLVRRIPQGTHSVD